MGRQVLFHLRGDDCQRFIRFVQSHDPVVIVERDSTSEEIVPVDEPCQPRTSLVFWNKELLPSLRRTYIPNSVKGPHYRISELLPIIEFTSKHETEWDGTPALGQSRIYSSFNQSSESLRKWYEALARWIRKHFAKNPIADVGGYVGPAALQWHSSGGLLLPYVNSPVTPAWQDILYSSESFAGRDKRTPRS